MCFTELFATSVLRGGCLESSISLISQTGRNRPVTILTPDVIAQYWGMAHDQPLVSPAMLATIASTFKDQQSSVPPAPLSSLCVTNPQLFPTPDFLFDPSPSIPPPPPCPLPVFIATPLSSEFMLCRGPFASRSQDPSF